MKKFVSIALVLVMILSMATVAFAATNVSGTDVKSVATSVKFNKNYTVTGGNTYPAETLAFTVTPDSGNPDTTTVTVDTDNQYNVTGATNEITIDVPAYSKVGTYVYTIKETAGNTQGVTYSTTEFDVTVLVYWNTEHTELKTDVKFTTGTTDDKVDTFTNEYKMGSLEVSKEVTGNLGDTTKEFSVDVTFTATKDIKSDITYVDGTDTKSIAAADMSDGSEKVTITVKHGETVKFTNIPDGVSYTVDEADYTTGEKNGENGYDAPKYNGVEAENATGSIENTKTATVKITNNKETTVATGISMDTIPYIVVLAVAVFGLVAVVANKRRAAEF